MRVYRQRGRAAFGAFGDAMISEVYIYIVKAVKWHAHFIAVADAESKCRSNDE